MTDLQAALAELNERLDSRHPDPMLQWERQIATQALHDLDRASFYLSVPDGMPTLRLFAPEVTAVAPQKPTHVEP
jgi:hypothetical protein